MKHRILAIDDETVPWLANFSAWIPEELAGLDCAATTEQAVELLRRRRYDVVLLDLSMDINNAFNRSNRGIQEYLATKPDGTQYIILSGVIEKTEVRDSAFHLNAFDIIFKLEMDPAVLREKLAAAIDESQRHQVKLVADAKVRLTQAGRLDTPILDALHPKDGAGSLYRLMDVLLARVAPIAGHRDRPSFFARGLHVFGLVWSRQLGKAVSLAMSSTKASEDESLAELAQWLGYGNRGNVVFSREAGRVRLLIFEEPSVADVHFDLPQIHAKTS
jgi:CheY-like chemotaxis protein